MLGFLPLATSPLTVNRVAQRVTGTLALTLGDISASASGSIGHPGSLTLTLDAISASATGKLVHSGTASVTLDDVQVSATGSIRRSGALSLTLDPIGFVAVGTEVHAGPFALNLDGITVALAGSVTRYGSLTVALADVAVQMTGQHGEVDDFRLLLEDINVSAQGIVVPPTPVSVVTKGGTDKHKKHRNFKSQNDQTERDIQKAVNKVFGIEEPDETAEIAEIQQPEPIPDFSAEIQRMALEAQAHALGQTIEQYQAMLDAERDDEEALLLLL